MGTLMLLRHGETTFNAGQVFTGLLDAGLTPAGESQVAVAAGLITDEGLVPDVLWQSTMLRARRTTELLLGHLGLDGVPIKESWRLVERAYGCLTGVSKSDARRLHGEEAFFAWRRTMRGRPLHADPATVATWTDPGPVPERGPLDAGIGESLADVVARVEPVWHEQIRPAVQAAESTVFLVAHGNTLRALAAVMHHLPDRDVEHLNIPAGHPFVVSVTPEQVGEPRYLDPHTAHHAAAAVAAEGGT
ncbi:MAG: 2,3-bisphosphoglycerate-dependent phosphoglycerate mutase [Propioniciclava sp.]|uniref:2,3-bisphosphoglycerate-dependent phosphoglycerate mutase n=1 Tax=Propioniciclava sp. TaxID=2038686 RepID=UPI0039E4BA97